MLDLDSTSSRVVSAIPRKADRARTNKSERSNGRTNGETRADEPLTDPRRIHSALRATQGPGNPREPNLELHRPRPGRSRTGEAKRDPMSSDPQPKTNDASAFAALGLSRGSVANLARLGYVEPTTIQAQSIPRLLAGDDLIGQAQTGTGKTAAFALPLLERISLAAPGVQALILTPTRELALQVSEALGGYSRGFAKVGIAAVYGGSPMGAQIRMIERGAQVVVGTPGRVMDLMRRDKLRLDALQLIVLDEADEMLRMGFLEDVEWVLSQAPSKRQIALFSATMPDAVQRIAQRYTHQPAVVRVARKELALPNIEQTFFATSGPNKLDALVRMLETESVKAGLVFVRTKAGCSELASALATRGIVIEPLNGDMSQEAREQTMRRMRAGKIDLVVATDVAARGIDIERISHVINYDIPGDVETYVHRIGRTGRAGREGKAILFITKRERWMLKKIEQFTNQRVLPHALPSDADIAAARREEMKQRLREVLSKESLGVYLGLVREMVDEDGPDTNLIAAAALLLLAGDQPLDPRQFETLVAELEEPNEGPKRGPRKGPHGKNANRKFERNRPSRPGKKQPRARGARPNSKAKRSHSQRD
jgi:ATP-dependent RNA helicase DeaD